MANPKKGFTFDNSTNSVTLSAIFSFFPDDFKKPTALEFLLPYLPVAGAAFVKGHLKDVKTSYFSYNWDLNGDHMPCDSSRPCFSGIDAIITGTSLFCVCLVFLCCFCASKKKSNSYEQV